MRTDAHSPLVNPAPGQAPPVRPVPFAGIIRVLIVEDQPNDAELMMLALHRGGFTGATAVRTASAETFLRELATVPDVILCDYSLPGFSALEALDLLRASGHDVPFIIVSGSIGEETAVEAIKRGADDYLLKDRLGRLGPAITQALEEKALRAATRRAEEDLRQSEFKYRCLFEHLPDAAYLCASGTGRIIDVNLRGEHLLGLDRAAILGQRLSDFLPEATWDALVAFAEDTSATSLEIATTFTGGGAATTVGRLNATLVPLYDRRLVLVFFRSASPD